MIKQLFCNHEFEQIFTEDVEVKKLDADDFSKVKITYKHTVSKCHKCDKLTFSKRFLRRTV